MPLGPAHQSQKRKNLFLLVILLVLMALFYAITIMKMAPNLP
jgi:hypothetical protein